MNVIGKMGTLIIQYQNNIEIVVLGVFAALIIFWILRLIAKSMKRNKVLNELKEVVHNINTKVDAIEKQVKKNDCLDIKKTYRHNAAQLAQVDNAYKESLNIDKVSSANSSQDNNNEKLSNTSKDNSTLSLKENIKNNDEQIKVRLCCEGVIEEVKAQTGMTKTISSEKNNIASTNDAFSSDNISNPREQGIDELISNKKKRAAVEPDPINNQDFNIDIEDSIEDSIEDPEAYDDLDMLLISQISTNGFMDWGECPNIGINQPFQPFQPFQPYKADHFVDNCSSDIYNNLSSRYYSTDCNINKYGTVFTEDELRKQIC